MASGRKMAAGAKKKPPIKGHKVGWREAVSGELNKAERLFVLGVGNRRKGDDAAGSLCVRLLKRELVRRKRQAGSLSGEGGPPPPRRRSRGSASLELRVHDAGETPENATGLIRRFRPTHVLVVDAAVGGNRPGSIFLVDKKKIRQEDVSTHRLPLSLLVRYLEESVGCRVILVGIEPRLVAWGKPASAAVRAAALRLADWLARTLTSRCSRAGHRAPRLP